MKVLLVLWFAFGILGCACETEPTPEPEQPAMEEQSKKHPAVCPAVARAYPVSAEELSSAIHCGGWLSTTPLEPADIYFGATVHQLDGGDVITTAYVVDEGGVHTGVSLDRATRPPVAAGPWTVSVDRSTLSVRVEGNGQSWEKVERCVLRLP